MIQILGDPHLEGYASIHLESVHLQSLLSISSKRNTEL